MLYFSEILNARVCREDGALLGKLKDLIFRADERSLVTKVVIRTTRGDHRIIPIQSVKRFDEVFTLSTEFKYSDIEENELFAVRNLLDKQIIDIQGNKIVRVNDILIQDKQQFLLYGFDIGTLGILRWFGLDKAAIRVMRAFGLKARNNVLSWKDIQPLELAKGRVQLKMEEEKLEKIRPEDLADHLEKLDIRNMKKFLSFMSDDQSAEVMENLTSTWQTTLFTHLSAEKAARLLSLMDPDEATDIVLTLTPKKQEAVMQQFSPEKHKEINYLLGLSTTPIGDLITSEYLTVQTTATVREIIHAVQSKTRNYSFMDYVYVCNPKQQLVGVFTLHELLLQKSDTPAYKFMTQNIIVIYLTSPKELTIKKMLKYRIHAIPVITNLKQMLGIVTFDDVADDILEVL